MNMKNSYDRLPKKEKELLSIAPGSSVGARVVESDLSYAIRRWKKALKDDGRLRQVFERQEFQKPSAVRRKQKLDAIYRQSMEKNETS